MLEKKKIQNVSMVCIKETIRPLVKERIEENESHRRQRNWPFNEDALTS